MEDRIEEMLVKDEVILLFLLNPVKETDIITIKDEPTSISNCLHLNDVDIIAEFESDAAYRFL